MKRILPGRQRQRGVSIIAAVFLLILFAALATYMLWLTSAQNRGSAQDVQGARAYQAARAGAEWGLFQLLRAGQCSAGTDIAFAGTELVGFVASVGCTRVASSDESGSAVSVYEITSTACNVPDSGSCADVEAVGNDYVERQVRVTTGCVVDGVTPACP